MCSLCQRFSEMEVSVGTRILLHPLSNYLDFLATAVILFDPQCLSSVSNHSGLDYFCLFFFSSLSEVPHKLLYLKNLLQTLKK